MKKKLLTIMTLAAVGSTCWLVGVRHGHKTSIIRVEYQTIRELAEIMPDATKANLLVVSGAQASGSDMELLNYIMPWVIAKRAELIGAKSKVDL